MWQSQESLTQNSLHIYNCQLCMFSHFSHIRLFVTLWTVACQASLSMGFSRQEYSNGLQCSPPGDFKTQALNPHLLHLLHCRQILYLVSHGESPWCLLDGRYSLFFSWIPSGLTILVAAVADDCDVFSLLIWQEVLHFSIPSGQDLVVFYGWTWSPRV